MPTRKADEITGNSPGGSDNKNNIHNHKDDENTPVAKKLKSSPTDMIIKLGAEKYEYHCHSIHMAMQSDFIDAALASPMRESVTKVIELPDVTPKIWGLMMKIIDSPHVANFLGTTMGDVLLAAEKFDQYQFINGLACCAKQVSLGFHQLNKMFHTDRLKAELKINSAIRHAIQCDKMQLKQSMPSVVAFFRLALAMPKEGKSYSGGLSFKEEQLKLLAPLIAKEKLVGDRWTEEEILCPLFPKHYLATLMKVYEDKTFGPMHQRKPMKQATLWLKKVTKTKKYKISVLRNTNQSSATPSFIGSPQPHSSIEWGNDELPNAMIGLKKLSNGGNWVIATARTVVGENGHHPHSQVLWRCPMSTNFVNFPPTKGWVKVDEDAPKGSLRIELGETDSDRHSSSPSAVMARHRRRVHVAAAAAPPPPPAARNDDNNNNNNAAGAGAGGDNAPAQGGGGPLNVIE
ncbi:unnamed protein product [Cylindrotheca closterium]|uniref:BTB domain-containing protein n=1 Tax=Cylindrotheca closterium TaxID=2856 RepID=A0AAD2G6Z9_9STRA|nr:unnamed protein product [Cylindrotheca closterium]